MNKLFVHILNNEIISKGHASLLNENAINLEVSEDIYNNIDNYKFKNGKLVKKTSAEIGKEQEKKKREELDSLSLTKREVFLALYKAKGITPEQLKAQITDSGAGAGGANDEFGPKHNVTEALIEFEYANEYFRGNPLIDLIGQKLGFTTEELDYLFEHGDFEDD